MIQLVRLAGYLGAVTTIEGKINKIDDIYRLKRVRINGGTPLNYFKEKVLPANHSLNAKNPSPIFPKGLGNLNRNP